MVKVLICGDVSSHHDLFCKRLETLQNSSHGPFDVVICLKMFASAEEYAKVAPGLSLPIPTFILDNEEEMVGGGYDSASGSSGSSSDHGFHFLKTGLQDVHGLAVMTCSENEESRDGMDPVIVKQAQSAVVDVLLTRDWPRDTHHFLRDEDLDVLKGLKVGLGAGAASVATLVAQVCPRYHIAGERGCFYQRPPYRNPPGKPCTRFISLAPVSATKDKRLKWLHALSLQPGNMLKAAELMAVPIGCSDNPYHDNSMSAGDGAPSAKRARTAAPKWAEELAGVSGTGGTAGVGSGEGNAFIFGAAAARKKGPRTEPPSLSATTLFVGNVPPLCSEEDVLAVFPSASACRKPDGKRFAFVSFVDHGAANDAVDTANNVERPVNFVLQDQVLVLGWADEAKQRGSGRDNARDVKSKTQSRPLLVAPVSDRARTLFFSGLPAVEGWSEEDLKMSLCPTAEKVKVIPHQSSSSSYAFVQFASHAEAADFFDKGRNAMQLPVKLKDVLAEGLEISWSKHEELSDATKSGPEFLLEAPTSGCQTLFLMPMPKNVACEKLAAVLGAAMVRQPEGRAYAFLEFNSHEDASRAFQKVSSGPVLVDGGDIELSAGWARGRPMSIKDHDAPCWFCLASETAKTHLVASVADGAYLALPRGGVHPMHVQIIPIQCVPSRLHLSAEAKADVLKYIRAVCALHSDSGFATFIFERALRTKGRDHMQTHVIPVPLQNVAGAVGKFLAAVGKLKVPFHELPEANDGAGDEDDDELDKALLTTLPGGPHQEYFYFQLPVGDGRRLRRFVYVPSGYEQNRGGGGDGGSPQFPMYLGIEVAAELLGDRSKARWKNNLLDEDGESQLTNQFRDKFEKYEGKFGLSS